MKIHIRKAAKPTCHLGDHKEVPHVEEIFNMYNKIFKVTHKIFNNEMNYDYPIHGFIDNRMLKKEKNILVEFKEKYNIMCLFSS